MEEATRIKFESIEAENNRQNHRIENLEEDLAQLRDIAASIEKLSINMQHMLDELKTQGGRIEKLESVPLETLKGAKQSAINTLVGVVVGALGVGIVELIVRYL